MPRRYGQYVDYGWTSYTAFSFSAKPKATSKQVIKYAITPTVDWTGAPTVFTFRTARSLKSGTVSWTLS